VLALSQRTIIHIDLDAFFVSVEQVLNPELKGKPVVVGGKPGSRGVVSTASYEARAYGLHSGMPISRAVRLCPQVIYLEGNYLEYREASKKFMAILADFAPLIEPMGLDEAFVDVTGFESLHGSIREMALKIKARVRQELGLVASVGIASCKIVAKVASDESKPDGLFEIPPGREAAFLAPLAIGKLPGAGPKTELLLKQIGISTIGDLASLRVEYLKDRFGSMGIALQYRARGIDNSEVAPRGEASSISREITFASDTFDKSFLTGRLSYLTEKVGNDLRHHQKQARCVSLKLRYADFTTITRSRTLPQAADTDQTIFQTASELMLKALASDRRAVRLIGVGVSHLTEPSRQLSLLNESAQRLEKLNRVVDSIRGKYGFKVIQTGRHPLPNETSCDQRNVSSLRNIDTKS
jgi:DNA polymerase-4